MSLRKPPPLGGGFAFDKGNRNAYNAFMNLKTQWLIGVACIVGVVTIGAALYITRPNEAGTGDTQPTSTVKVLPAGDARAPSLTTTITYTAQLDERTKGLIGDKITSLRKSLFEDPTDIATWLDLALQYKAAGDFAQAEAVWLYLNEAAPGQTISFHNLGNLYHFELKDFPESEMMYREAIQKAPTLALHYIGLYELYKYSYKQNTNAGADILLEAIKAIPDSPDLLSALARHYQDIGNTQRAIHYYTEARDKARALGNAALVQQLDAEIRALK